MKWLNSALLIGGLLMATPSFTQSLVDDLKAVSAVLDTAHAIQLEVSCKVYTRQGGELISEVNTGMIKKGKWSVSTFEDLKVFTNEKYGVYVNTEEKSIMLISKAKHTSRLKSMDDKGIQQFLSWMKKQQANTAFNPQMISEEDHVRTYAVKNLNEVKELLISINVKTHAIVRITYEFETSSQQKYKFIVLNYAKFLINTEDINLDQTDYYIQKSGKFFPGNKYKSYSITTDL